MNAAQCTNPAVPPRLIDYERPRSSVRLIPLFVLVPILTVLFTFNPARFPFYPVCNFYRLTGLHCPGCGALRAIHQLLHGDILSAIHYNALLVCSLPFLGWYLVRLNMRQLNREPVSQTIRPSWLWMAFGVLVLFGILRNLPWFSWLAPHA